VRKRPVKAVWTSAALRSHRCGYGQEWGSGTAVPAAGRRRWTIHEKREIVEQSLAPGSSAPAVAAKHGVRASQVYRWMRLYQQASEAGTSGAALLPVSVARRNHPRVVGAAHVPGQPGVIELEVGNAQVRVQGDPDLCSLRMVPDYLLR